MLDTHEVHQSDTHEVHLQNEIFCLLSICNMLDTHEVHLTEEDLQERSSAYYQVRHPRGAPHGRRPSRKIFCLLSS
jgi:hypothetical protein